ncbi:MAG: VOC family protein [Trueperaceae bacterium]
MPNVKRITPCLWFEDQAEEAATFYTSTFANSKLGSVTRYGREGHEVHGRPEGTVMTVQFEVAGLPFTALNGGPHFRFTPATSFFVNCESASELDALWEKLSSGGSLLMPLQSYPFSERYGWVSDRYGLSWQLNLANSPQAIVPFLMFVGTQNGRAEEAARFYASVFENSGVETIEHFGAEDDVTEGTVKRALYSLDGQEFMALDGGLAHDFTFTEAVSFMVGCESQKEVDYFWGKLSEGGDERAQQCGWLKDKFGVSWQVVPDELGELVGGPDSEKSQRAVKAMLRMKKIDIGEIRRAYQGAI